MLKNYNTFYLPLYFLFPFSDKAESLSSFLKKNFHGDDYDISKGSEPVSECTYIIHVLYHPHSKETCAYK